MSRTRLSGRVRLRAAALAVLGTAMLGASCTTPSLQAPDDPTFRVERHTWGGLCPMGPCRSDLVITADGQWALRTEAGERKGRLSPSQLASLHNSAVRTRLPASPAGPRECDANADGRSWTYRWTVLGETAEASSCEGSLDMSDPLVLETEKLANKFETSS